MLCICAMFALRLLCVTSTRDHVQLQLTFLAVCVLIGEPSVGLLLPAAFAVIEICSADLIYQILNASNSHSHDRTMDSLPNTRRWARHNGVDIRL